MEDRKARKKSVVATLLYREKEKLKKSLRKETKRKREETNRKREEESRGD